MIVKVCGIKYAKNASEVTDLPIQMVGFNFYEASSRYVSPVDAGAMISNANVKRIGVFVNAGSDTINETIRIAKLDGIQLHGSESPNIVEEIDSNVIVIKALGVDDESDMLTTELWQKVDYLLFDKKSPLHGGTGNKFDWSLLSSYKGDKPFLVAGGISPNDEDLIREISNPKFAGLDINSKFEDEPGLKNVKLIYTFLKKLNINK